MLKKSGVNSSFRAWLGDPTLLSHLIATNSAVPDPQSHSGVVPTGQRQASRSYCKNTGPCILLGVSGLCLHGHPLASALMTHWRCWVNEAMQSSLASEIIGTITRSWSFLVLPSCVSLLWNALRQFTPAVTLEFFSTASFDAASGIQEHLESHWFQPAFRTSSHPGIPALIALGCCRNQLTQTGTNRLTGGAKHWDMITHNYLGNYNGSWFPLWLWNANKTSSGFIWHSVQNYIWCLCSGTLTMAQKPLFWAGESTE